MSRNTKKKRVSNAPRNRNSKVGDSKKNDGSMLDDVLNFIALDDLFDIMVNGSLFIGFVFLLVSVFVPTSLFVAYVAITGLILGIILQLAQVLAFSLQMYRGKMPGNIYRSRRAYSIAA